VAAELHAYNAPDGKPAGSFSLKGAENEEMLLAAPPHLTPQDSLILITRGGQVRAVGSPATPAAAPDSPPSSGAASPAETPPPAPAPDTDAAGATGPAP
jgi:hypothetical protein